MIRIDGSTGEGGGQILRTALSLSAVKGQPVRIDRIRANRRQPGLRPQHVTAVRSVAATCGARLEGDRVGSDSLLFEPQHVPRAGRHEFDVREAAKGGSAGSASLVFQTLLLPLAAAIGPSELIVRGGTHVAWSPPFHYLRQVYLPLVRQVGVGASIGLRQWGWYPRGGGVMHAVVTGSPGSQAPGTGHPAPASQHPTSILQLTDRGNLNRLWGIAATSRLPEHIRKRLVQRAWQQLRPVGVRAEIESLEAPSPGPGAGLFLFAEYDCGEYGTVTAGFSGFGRRGKPAEQVADEASAALLAHHRSGAPVDPHLADQLILPLTMAGVGARFRTSEVTRHLLTNVWVIQKLIDVAIGIEGKEGAPGVVHIRHDS